MARKKPEMNLSIKGRLVADPVLGFARKTGVPYCEVNLVYNTHGPGNPFDKPLFFKFMAYGTLADAISQCYSKGDWLHIVKSKAKCGVRKCKCKTPISYAQYEVEEIDMSDVLSVPEEVEWYLKDEEDVGP